MATVARRRALGTELLQDRRRQGIDYDDRGGVLTRIALVNALLSMLTLGLYRFWAKTRLRRHLWSNLALYGERMEYVGRPQELLLGFLIVVLVLLPLFLALRLLDVAVLPFGDDVMWFKNLGTAGLMYFLAHFGLYRARRYRLSRTLWCGIRCGQTGSALRYAIEALSYSFLTMITLGLTYPMQRTELYRYRIENTWLGDHKCEFDGQSGALMGIWVKAWMPIAIIYAISFLLAFLQAASAAALPVAGLTGAEVVATFLGIIIIFSPFILSAVFYLQYRAREFRYFANNTSFGDLRVNSELSVGPIVLIHLLYFGLLAALAWLFILLGMSATAALEPSRGWSPEAIKAMSGTTIAILLLLGLAFFILAGALRTILVVRQLLITICETTWLSGPLNPARIRQNWQLRPDRGEGLADALDVGGF